MLTLGGDVGAGESGPGEGDDAVFRVSTGTRNSGAADTPITSPGSNPAQPARGIFWRPWETKASGDESVPTSGRKGPKEIHEVPSYLR